MEEKRLKPDGFEKPPIIGIKIIFFILLLSFVIISIIVSSGVSDDVDTRVTRTLYEDHGKDNHTLMRFISFFGGYYGLIPGSLIVIGYLFYKRLPRRGMLFTAMTLFSVAIFMIIKIAIGRPRPDFGLLHPLDYSYPSGHATASFVFYVGLYFYLFYEAREGLELWKLLPLLLLPIIIGVSRLFLALHYPTDIIGGFLLGGCVLASFYLFGRRYDVL
ncbi:MAG: phosphatase PAP2 family protein [Thermoplasmata archaeon]